MSAPYTFQTDAQFRAFYRLTLAQVVFLESSGLSFTRAPARVLAKRLLDLKDPIATADIINALRKAAAECVSPEAEAPTRPYIPGHGMVSPITAAAIEEAARVIQELNDGR